MSTVQSTSPENGKYAVVAATLSHVAYIFGKSRDTMRDWRRNGMPGKPGHFDVREILTWYLSRASSGRNDGSDENRAESEARKAAADADMAEMKAAVMRGELIEVDTICREYVHSATHTRAMLEQIPHRFMAGLIERCPHCNEPVYTGDDKRRILDANKGHVDDAIEAIHSCLAARMEEPQDTEEDDHDKR